MKLFVTDRLNLMNILPRKGTLDTMAIVRRLSEKLGIFNGEREELDLVVGRVCANCGSPVEKRDEGFFCPVCHKIVETKGKEGRVTWNLLKDQGKEINFAPEERNVIIQAMMDLDKAGEITPQLSQFWEDFTKAYPGKEDNNGEKD